MNAAVPRTQVLTLHEIVEDAWRTYATATWCCQDSTVPRRGRRMWQLLYHMQGRQRNPGTGRESKWEEPDTEYCPESTASSTRKGVGPQDLEQQRIAEQFVTFQPLVVWTAVSSVGGAAQMEKAGHAVWRDMGGKKLFFVASVCTNKPSAFNKITNRGPKEQSPPK